MATEKMALPELTQTDADKFDTFNTALRQLEGQLTFVLSRANSGPPGSPAEGDSYIVDVASGAWAAATVKDIAHYYGGQWTFYTPSEGAQKLRVRDENIEIVYDGTNWVNSALESMGASGTLTAGTIPFVNTTIDGFEFDTTAFGFDKTNNRLGVGDATPDYTIDMETGESNVATIGTSDADIVLRANGTRSIKLNINGTQRADVTSTGMTIEDDLTVGNSGTGDIYVPNGGIALSGGTDLLDTYEKGTWTPVIADAASGGNLATFTNISCTYTRIGRLVTVRLNVSAINTTGLTGGNALFIRGLPFVNATSTYTGSARFDNIAFNNPPVFNPGAGQSYTILTQSNTAAGAANILVNALTSGTAAIRGTFSYYV